MAKRQLQGEGAYRRELWAAVERLLKTRQMSKTDLARHWEKPKSTVTRLSEGEVPTTLGNLEEIASRVFDLDLADFLGLILHPVDPAQAQQRAALEMWRTVESERNQFLAGLHAGNSRRVMYAVGRLAQSAPADLALIADMLEATANERWQRTHQHSPLPSPFAPDDQWSSQEEEES